MKIVAEIIILKLLKRLRLKRFPVHQNSVNIFHILDLKIYLFLADNMIPLKLVLRSMGFVAFSLVGGLYKTHCTYLGHHKRSRISSKRSI